MDTLDASTNTDDADLTMQEVPDNDDDNDDNVPDDVQDEFHDAASEPMSETDSNQVPDQYFTVPESLASLETNTNDSMEDVSVNTNSDESLEPNGGSQADDVSHVLPDGSGRVHLETFGRPSPDPASFTRLVEGRKLLGIILSDFYEDNNINFFKSDSEILV